LNTLLLAQNPKMLRQPVQGIVQQAIAPDQPGRITYQGSYWPAKFFQPDHQAIIAAGDSATIIGRLGITLLVVPD
jgi:membrane protein implicated in regulation of membrane protease activity